MIAHMVPGSNTKPSEENIGMFETAVMVAVVDVLCNSLMSEEQNIYLLFSPSLLGLESECWMLSSDSEPEPTLTIIDRSSS